MSHGVAGTGEVRLVRARKPRSCVRCRGWIRQGEVFALYPHYPYGAGEHCLACHAAREAERMGRELAAREGASPD